MKTPWFSRSGPSHSPGPAITSEESGLEEPSAHLAYCANLSCTAERFMLTVFLGFGNPSMFQGSCCRLRPGLNSSLTQQPAKTHCRGLLWHISGQGAQCPTECTALETLVISNSRVQKFGFQEPLHKTVPFAQLRELRINLPKSRLGAARDYYITKQVCVTVFRFKP